MKTQKWTLNLLITLEGSGTEESHVLMTGQMARDKILTPIQELWVLGHLKKFSLEEVEPELVEPIMKGKIGGKQSFSREQDSSNEKTK